MMSHKREKDLKRIVWEEVFTDGAKLDSNSIVQVWKGFGQYRSKDTIKKAINKGYKTILSAPWYFDWHKRE